MNKETLLDILCKVWMRDWSADDAFAAIFGEPFEGYTKLIENKTNEFEDWEN